MNNPRNNLIATSSQPKAIISTKPISCELVARRYWLPYPYTLTILALIAINVGLFLYLSPPLVPYLQTLSFTFIFGLLQIIGLENLSNKPAWLFPVGSAYFQDKGLSLKNVILEDILFIPSCASLFFLFMWSIRGVDDILSNSFVMAGTLFLLCVEASIYQIVTI